MCYSSFMLLECVCVCVWTVVSAWVSLSVGGRRRATHARLRAPLRTPRLPASQGVPALAPPGGWLHLTTKATNFCPPPVLADPGASCSTVARPARPMVRTPCSWLFTKWLARSMPQHVFGSASQPFWWRGLRVAGACAPWNARAERQSGHPPPAR